ncbi:MAG: porin family protein [Bacteroidales bacterium]|nr:porin family protein [Bacteroidales bacterium]
MNKFLKIVFLLSLIVTWNNLLAQKDTLKNNVIGAFLIMPIEFPIIDNNALNEQLNSFGFPSANYSTANIGIGLQLHINRVITTFSFCKTTKKNEQSSHLTEIEYRSTSLNIGYDLLKSQWFSLYPYVGFKGCGLNYLYRDRLPDGTSFDNYFKADLKYKEVTNSRAHLDLGVGFSHQWFYLINFRFGYLLPLEKIQWNMNNNQTILSKSPTINYNYYFSLTLGIGSIVSDNGLRRRYSRNE